jgi:hypothetical protein
VPPAAVCRNPRLDDFMSDAGFATLGLPQSNVFGAISRVSALGGCFELGSIVKFSFLGIKTCRT